MGDDQMTGIYGIDFGTSNTVLSYGENRKTKLLGLSQSGPIIPSIMFFSKDSPCLIGEEAVKGYLKATKGWKLGTQKNMYDYYRFFQAIKLSLKDGSFTSTKIFNEVWDIEDIVAEFLRQLRTMSDQITGKRIKKAVFGRPVQFAIDPDEDEFIQKRFEKACYKAGFEEAYFVHEPTAALFSNLANASGKILIFDFGGGTLDICVAKINNNRITKVLANTGMGLGGYIIDEEIARRKLLRHFGRGTKYASLGKTLEIPGYVTEQVTSSFALPIRDHVKIRECLREIRKSSLRPETIKGLETFLANNMYFPLYQAIDKAKIELSDKEQSTINFNVEEYITIKEPITRQEFEEIIKGHLIDTGRLLEKTLAEAKLNKNEINQVFLIGGSSQIPAFTRLLESFFPGRIHRGSVLTDVADGLIKAYEHGFYLKR